MSPPSVRIITLHWGDPAVTAACLQSLRESDLDGMTVVVVDNGTPDQSGASLREQFPEFVHLRLDHNLGFTGGNNVALRQALEEGVDYAVLLNNDTLVRPTALRQMVAAAEADARIGLVNPKILFEDPPGLVWYAGGHHSLWTGLPDQRDRGRPDRGAHDAAESVTFMTGCALLVRRQTLEQIGLLDESLFMYAEDIDWSIKALRAGWRLWYEPSAVVIHRERVQRRKSVPDPFRLRLATRNALRVNWRHASWLQRLCLVPWFGLRWVAYLTVKNLVLGFPGDAVAIWAGVLDALRGRTGPLTPRRSPSGGS